MHSEESVDADRTLDAREVDGAPFDDIVTALEELSDGESLLVVQSFDPKPLYDVLEERGFEHETTNPAPDEWHVEITEG